MGSRAPRRPGDDRSRRAGAHGVTPASAVRPRLSDLVIAETVRLLERGGPLDDDRAMRLAFAEQSTHEARLLARARLLGDRFGLGDAWQRWRALMPVALGLAALAIGLLSWGICSAVVGHDRQINALAALASVLGPHLLSLLAWIVATAFGGALWGASIGAAVSRASLWLATRLMPQPGLADLAERRPAVGLMPQALGGLLRRAGLAPWLFGLASHAAWAIGFVLIVAGLFMAFSFQSYRLNWETTILGPGFFVDAVRVLGWLPARLGLPTPDEASVLSASTAAAAQQWAWWLIGCTVAYGLLPRLALAAIGAAVWKARRPALRLDLAAPYYRQLIARFAAMDAPQVVDVEQAAPPRAVSGADTDMSRRAASAVIGFELPPETAWPRAGQGVADWTERIEGSSDERRQVLDRVAHTRPSRLLLICHAGSSPDRGVERFFRDSAIHGSQLRLLLVDGVGNAGTDRWRDWLQASGLAAIHLSRDEAEATRWLAATEDASRE
jgi:hypothetical protein